MWLRGTHLCILEMKEKLKIYSNNYWMTMEEFAEFELEMKKMGRNSNNYYFRRWRQKISFFLLGHAVNQTPNKKNPEKRKRKFQDEFNVYPSDGDNILWISALMHK